MDYKGKISKHTLIFTLSADFYFHPRLRVHFKSQILVFKDLRFFFWFLHHRMDDYLSRP